MWGRTVLLSIAVFLATAKFSTAQAPGYYGKYIGKLKTLHHSVTGEVFAVDARTLHIRDFTYDGEGPAAFFYAGNSKVPSASGFRINDERGSPQPLQRYVKKHVTITLPDGKTLHNIKWFSVWCDEFSVNFGDVKIPKNLDYPRPQKIDQLSGVHLVSSDPIVVVDAQTLLIPNFSYDGEAPDAKFWVGRGNRPSPQGVRVPDENGKEVPLRRYDRKTIVLTLPGDLTVFDIGHFGVWCEAFTVDFGHIRIPPGLNVPPSLKMLGVAPQSKLNCEVLWDELAFEVRWAVAGDSVVMQLVSKLEDGEYMSFGLSGDDSRSKMIGGDVVVAWVDKTTLKGYANDYFLDSKSQCAGTRGSCPDERLRENTGNVRLLNAAMVNGYSIVTYQRPLKAQDEFDIDIVPNSTQPIIWAIGPLNSRNEVSYHSLANKRDVLLNFGRAPKWNCPIPETDSTPAAAAARPSSEHQAPAPEPQLRSSAEPTARNRTRTTHSAQATPAPAPKTDAWEIPAIQCYEPEDGIFYAQMGPTGGKHGYPAITGHVGWGISWYINGLLIPEINVVRGKTYTFVVEGGLDPETPARYHPFYITDDPVGGYEHKTPEERAAVRIFAGARQNRRGDVYPTGTGRLCNWKSDPNQPPADEFASFGAYQRTLTLECDQGEPGIVQWTPDKNTPDTVYYQCFTHRYLGWKINVLDTCDTTPAASNPIPVRVPANEEDLEDSEDDDEEGELQSRPSIQVPTRVKPNGVHFNMKDNFSKQTEHKYIPLKEFANLPSDTQHNFHQDFPFSYEPITTTRSVVLDEGNIRNALLPPPVLLKEPTYSTQYTGQVQNASNDNSVAQVLVRDSYFPQTIPVKDGDTIWVKTHHSADKPNSSGLNIQPPQETPVVSIQVNPSGLVIQNVQQNFTAPEPQQPATEVTVDPKRKPVLHATTPLPVISFSLVSDSKQAPDVEASATSSVNVTSDNRLTSGDIQVKVPVIPMALTPGMINLHTTRIPQGYGRIPVFPQIMFQRPMQPYNFMSHLRHPVPHRGFHRPPVSVYHPQYATSTSNQHNFIIKKPYYRPTPRPMTITPQFHLPFGKTRIPLQQSSTSIKTYHFTLAPSIQTLKLRKVSSTTSTSTTTPLPAPTQAPNLVQDGAATIKPSPSILPPDVVMLKPLDSHIPVAVNTGFNPHSVVVEGGFKPIITSKNVEAQDRSVVDEEALEVKEKPEASTNKTEEAIVEELASEIVAVIAEEERKDNPFQGQEPEMFEPMFIPSPPDRNAAQNSSDIKKPILAEELTPPVAHMNHRHSLQPSRKNVYPFMMIRPRPGLVRRPLYPSNIVPPFRIPVRGGSPTFRYQQADDYTEDETPMAAERMDSYLPPVDSSIPSGVAVTYDGKSVASIPPAQIAIKNIRVPLGTADLIRGMPQFAPFRGEIPPPVPDVISLENIPQLSKENQQQAQTLPEQFKQQNDAFPHPPPIERTQLLLIQQDSEELNSDSSEIKEVTAASKGNKLKKQSIKKPVSIKDEGEIMSTVDDRWPFSTNLEGVKQMEESTITVAELDGTTLKQTADQSQIQPAERRERRSAHHEPGHVGYDYQHSGHDHSSHQNSSHNHSNHHDHSQHKQSRATCVTVSSVLLMLSPIVINYL